jgi:hypothetical protein
MSLQSTLTSSLFNCPRKDWLCKLLCLQSLRGSSTAIPSNTLGKRMKQLVVQGRVIKTSDNGKLSYVGVFNSRGVQIGTIIIKSRLKRHVAMTIEGNALKWYVRSSGTPEVGDLVIVEVNVGKTHAKNWMFGKIGGQPSIIDLPMEESTLISVGEVPNYQRNPGGKSRKGKQRQSYVNNGARSTSRSPGMTRSTN